MNNVENKRREKSIPQKSETKMNINKPIDDKKNSYEKFNLKINKKIRPEINKELKFEGLDKIRPQTFDYQKRANFQSDYKFTDHKTKELYNKRSYRAKPSYTEKIHNFKDNNLMKFKKKTTGIDDLIPFIDVHKLANNDSNFRNIIGNYNKSKSKINYADMSSMLMNGIDIELKKKVNNKL